MIVWPANDELYGNSVFGNCSINHIEKYSIYSKAAIQRWNLNTSSCLDRSSTIDKCILTFQVRNQSSISILNLYPSLRYLDNYQRSRTAFVCAHNRIHLRHCTSKPSRRSLCNVREWVKSSSPSSSTAESNVSPVPYFSLFIISASLWSPSVLSITASLVYLIGIIWPHIH